MLLVELCMPLSKATESIILSIINLDIFCFKMLLNIYLKIKTAYLNRYFIIKFFDCTKIENKGTVKLLKAKELFKLYKRTRNSNHLRNTIKAVRRLNKKEAREARFKISIYLEDYANALEYSNGINKFIALAELDIKYSLELLLHENRLKCIFGENNKNVTLKQLFTLDGNDENKIIIQLCKKSINGLVPKKQNREKNISQYLEFVIELFCRLNKSPLKLFLFSQQNYPNSLSLKLRIIRYLKHNHLQNALQYGTFIIRLELYDNPIFHLMIYEVAIIYRKLGMDFMKFLYWARRKMNITLFSQEISYFEGKKYKYIKKHKEFDDNHSALYLAKEIILKSCNNTGICLRCRDKCKINSTNGDFIILRYFCDRDLSIKNIVDHLEITEGFYWKQLTGILEFEKKMKIGIKLISFDFGN